MHSFKTILGFAALLVSASALPFSYGGTSENPVINLDYAQYQGLSNSTLGVTTFFGLQYAAPPTGSQRWQPPIPIENSTVFGSNSSQIVNATAYGFQCPQTYPVWFSALESLGGDFAGTQTLSSEDCLRLDVIVPNSPASTSLPIVVQIHGGGYTVGNTQVIDGHEFTSYSNGSVIYVQIQYRLGFYGFLNSQAVISNGVANAGLLDQRAALEWIQRNIAKFGGDPTQVTIWGGSAGGGSVTAQLQLYGGEQTPPFRAAIPEYPWWQPFHNSEVLEAQYNELLQASNCTDLTCLRSLSYDVLYNATQEVYVLGYAAGNYGYGDFYAGPAVDGNVIKDLPSIAFATGQYSKVPMIIDRDGFEGAIFTNFTLSAESQVQPDLTALWQTNSTSFFTRLFQLYPQSDYTGPFFVGNPFFSTFSSVEPTTANNSVYWQTQAIFGDFIIACPTYYVASALSDSNQRVWKLVFEAGSEVHGATAPFFTTANNETTNPTIAAQMKSYWLGFIVNLDPNSAVGNGSGPSRPNWPTYLSGGETGGFTVLIINQTDTGLRPDPDANGRCDFFHGQPYVVRN